MSQPKLIPFSWHEVIRQRPRAYSLAAFALVAALLLRWLLDPVMGDTLPLVTLFGAVAAAVWFAGYLPAALVAILGYLACAYLFIEPRGSLDLDTERNLIGLAAYVFTCSIIIGLGEAARIAHRRAELQRESLRTTLASIGDAVIATDPEGRITNMNAVAESLTGWPQAEAIGRPLADVFRVVNEKTGQVVDNPGSKVLKEGIIVGLANHTVLIARDGTERPIDDSAAPIRGHGGEIIGCVMIFRDISERRWAEKALKRNERELHDFFENATVGLHWAGPDGTILRVNQTELDLLGYRYDEYLGHNIAEFHVDPKVSQDTLERLTRGETLHEYPAQMRCKDGSIRDVLINSNVMFDDGLFIHSRCFTRDVTDRLRVESELREADRRKNEFLAMLAHELRNPLTPIRNAVQVLRLTGNDPEAVQSASGMLERQVDQMARLVDDLLDVSRITRGKIELRRTRVELAGLVQDAVEAARPQVQCMDHELTVTIPPAPIHLYADSARLTQIVGNLLNNACKFTDRGGRIGLIVEREGTQAIIRVRDTGIGISADQLPRVFEMFMQVDTSLERSVGGLGIGLTLVKNLAELHGGTVEVQSAGLGRGSEFVVRLPILSEEAKETPLPAAGEPAGAPPKARRILIVDDNRDSATSLATLLQLIGNEAYTAFDGAEGLKLAEKFRPDVVLLDIGLPKLNGYEVARALRKQPWGKSMVVVALTGLGQVEDRQRSNEAGFDGHLVKPVDLASLTQFLADAPPGNGDR